MGVRKLRIPSGVAHLKSVRLLALALLGLVVGVDICEVHAQVVISEANYHPPAPFGRQLEFVELYNPADGAVDLSGWRLTRAVRFTFPAGTKLEPGRYLVVARHAEELRDFFAITSPIFGDYLGTLDNGGDTVLLVDNTNSYVDQLRYCDEVPWPIGADGTGGSLQRRCHDGETSAPQNWIAATPTPLRSGRDSACPLPPFESARVVINELHYHPARENRVLRVGDDGEATEYLELHNPGPQPIDIGGWRFSDGIAYEFPAGVVIPAGGYALTARDPNVLRSKFGLAGDVFIGKYRLCLSNRGERVTLVDQAGRIVDTVVYGDGGDWPYVADGQGHSLERISVDHPGDDPANWMSSEVARQSFLTFTGIGRGSFLQDNRVGLVIDGEGELLVDHVVLEDVLDPGVNLLSNGDFDSGLDGWTIVGNARDSSWEPAGGENGSGALRLVADEACFFEGCSPADGVFSPTTIPLNLSRTYRLTVTVRFVSGSTQLVAAVVAGVQANVDPLVSPARRNSVAGELRPYIDYVGRFPQAPASADRTWITAHVRSPEPAVVTLNYRFGASDRIWQVRLTDEGRADDRLAGDGVYGTRLSPFPDNTQVEYWVTATIDGATRTYPQLAQPDRAAPEERIGYYVSDVSSESPIPAYHILISEVDGSDWLDVNASLSCGALSVGAFAHNGDLYPAVGLRWRGNTACVLKKRNFKIRFNRSQPFEGQDKLNLNGLWTDKALVRELLAWQFVEEIGAPELATQYVRVFVNGSYYGLFLSVEHPDRRFLRRNSLSPDSSIYKARQPSLTPDGGLLSPAVSLQPPGNYDLAWEEENNEGRDFSDIEDFITTMHDEGSRLEFWQERGLPDTVINFQLTQIVLNNIDSAAKNHFLVREAHSNRWGILSWDLDLIFGKFFTREAEGGRRPVGTLNDLMASDVGLDLGPWFMTGQYGNDLFNWFMGFFFSAGDGYYQRAYLTRLWDLMQEKYTPAEYQRRLDELVALIFEEQEDDFELWGRYPSNVQSYPADMLSNVDIIVSQIRKHRDFLLSYIPQMHPEIPDHPQLRISEVGFAEVEADGRGEFIELVNTSGRSIDVGKWTIDAIDFVFPDSVVVPVDGIVVVSKLPSSIDVTSTGGGAQVFGPFAGRLANDGEVIRVRDAGSDYAAIIDYLSYKNGDEGWPHVPLGHTLQLLRVSRDSDNDLPSAWIVSAHPGGDPGMRLPEFVRGDVVVDARIQITDAISILLYLFAGSVEPACLDSADVDDDGRITVTDPLVLLNYLFDGARTPAAPFPNLGSDPTADDLHCTW